MVRSFDDCILLTFEHSYLNSPSVEFECTDEFLIFNSYIRELILRPSVAYKNVDVFLRKKTNGYYKKRVLNFENGEKNKLEVGDNSFIFVIYFLN